MRASHERERDRQNAVRRRREDHAAIKHALGEELMPDDLSGLREEFIVNLMGKEEAEKYFQREHEAWVQQRRTLPRTLRCRVFGCKPRDACEHWPTCELCPGSCQRCARPVMPKARLLR